MFASLKMIAALGAAAALTALTPAIAKEIPVTGRPTFRDLEFDRSGADRIEAATTYFNTAIPAGTDISDARIVVRRAGAHCGAAVGDGETRCIFSSFAAVDDHLHDIVWTIRLDSRSGRIARVDVSRESIGS